MSYSTVMFSIHSSGSIQVRLVSIFVACSMLFGFAAGPAVAQDSDGSPVSKQVSGFAPVAMAWSDVRPLFFSDDEGAVTGLGAELAFMLGRELGFDIKPYRITDFATWGRDQNSGVSEILPMAAKLPVFAENNVFSDVVFTSDVRFAVRVEDSDAFDYKNVAGKRIGVLPPGAGSVPALYPGASTQSFPNTRAALISLLSDEIDAI
ncbi:MAG: substrate-binding periplasmic protein [Granulosicoccus sp.]